MLSILNRLCSNRELFAKTSHGGDAGRYRPSRNLSQELYDLIDFGDRDAAIKLVAQNRHLDDRAKIKVFVNKILLPLCLQQNDILRAKQTLANSCLIKFAEETGLNAKVDFVMALARPDSAVLLDDDSIFMSYAQTLVMVDSPGSIAEALSQRILSPETLDSIRNGDSHLEDLEIETLVKLVKLATDKRQFIP